MKNALLVVDAQKIYTDQESDLYCENATETIGNINKLIQKAEKEGNPIFFIRHIHKSDGSDIGRMFDYAGDEVEDFEFKDGTDDIELDDNLYKPNKTINISKTRYSAFIGTKLDNKLNSLQINRVAICGFMTNFCCESTARDAHDRDFFVDFVVDATGTPGTTNMDQKQIREIVSELLDEGFACVYKTEEYLDA